MTGFGMPCPYPQEIAYGIIARHLRNWGYQHNAFWLRRLFGGTIPAQAVELPARTLALVRALNQDDAITPRQFVQRHTLLPYYLASLPATEGKAILHSILNEEVPDIGRRLQFGKWNTCAPDWFRFCAECMQEDRHAYGEAYWHRQHQLPGVIICLRHETFLYRSKVPLRAARAAEYRAPSPMLCTVSPAQREQGVWKVARYVAQHSVSLLDKPLGTSAHVSPAGYKRMLRGLGFRARAGRVATNALEQDITAYFQHARLGALLPIHRTSTLFDWYAAYQHVPHSFLPVRHILLRCFITEADGTRRRQQVTRPNN